MTPNTPSAASSTPTPSASIGRAPLVVALVVALALVGGLVGTAVMATRAAANHLAAEMQRANDALIQAVKNIPMQPPSNDKLFNIMSKGLGVSENVVATSEVGVVPTAAFATDLTAAQQTDAFTQEIVIQNRDGTDILCFKPIPWASAGANCAAKCAAFAITCPAAGGAGTTATDGTVTPPGGAWPRRYDGTSCICIVGSAANTAYQTERVIR